MNITENLLTPNPFSRPGRAVHPIQALVMHWTAAPMQRATETRNYWDGLKNQDAADSNAIYASAHYIIDMDGSILQTLEETEIAYQVGSRKPDPASGKVYTDWARACFGDAVCDPHTIGPNVCTLGIEMEPVDGAGNFTVQTLTSAVELAADILLRHSLDTTGLTTHHEIVGYKDCPRLWVNNPALFTVFKEDVAAKIAALKSS
jgi:N-acetylmuramoyl-L-alanine amidase